MWLFVTVEVNVKTNLLLYKNVALGKCFMKFLFFHFRGLRKSGGKGKKQEKENQRGSLDSR